MTTASTKRILCSRCRLYDSVRRCCTISKVNPRTRLDTYETAQVLGVRAVCPFNPYRERMVSPPHQ